MSFHVLGFYRNVPIGTLPVEFGTIADAVVATNSATNPTRFFLSEDARIFAAYAGCPNLERARIYTPWKLPNEVRPASAALLPPSVPPIAEWLDAPVVVPAGQDIIFDVVHSNGGAAQDAIGVALITTEGLTPRPRGEVLTLQVSFTGGSFVAGIRAWTEPPAAAVNWEYALPPGRYAVVGSEFISTNAIAHRWILQGTTLRPGGLGQTSLSGIPSDYQLSGVLGNWGTFTAPLMPRLELLCNAADAAAVMRAFIQVMRI